MNARNRYQYLALLFSLAIAWPVFADGNLAIELDNNGNLEVEGEDNTDQRFIIESTGFVGELLFTSTDGTTTFNGQAELLVSGAVGDVEIDLRSGMKIVGLTHGNSLFLPIGGDLVVKNRGSNSVGLGLDGVNVQGRIEIRLKNGNDAIAITESSSVERARINAGQGQDSVIVGQSSFADELEVKGGGGEDSVLIFDDMIVLGQLDLKSGGQNDMIFLADILVGDARINGNGGDDAYTFGEVDFLEERIRSIELETVLDADEIQDAALDLLLDSADANLALNDLLQEVFGF